MKEYEIGNAVKVVSSGYVYYGTIFRIVLECDDNNINKKPHAVVFIEDNVALSDGDEHYGHLAIWTDAIDEIYIVPQDADRSTLRNIPDNTPLEEI